MNTFDIKSITKTSMALNGEKAGQKPGAGGGSDSPNGTKPMKNPSMPAPCATPMPKG